MGVNRQDVLNMHRVLQEQQDLPKLQQMALQNPMNQQPTDPNQQQGQMPLDPTQPQQQSNQPQGLQNAPDLSQAITQMVQLLQASIIRTDINFDIQTKGILTIAQAIQQLYASGHVEQLAQQHGMMLNEQDQAHTHGIASGQAQLQGQQQAHQQAMDAARLQMESASHQQQMQQSDEMHKAKLLQLGHQVASNHEKQSIDIALKAQQANHTEEKHKQNVQQKSEMHDVQKTQAQQAKPTGD